MAEFRGDAVLRLPDDPQGFSRLQAELAARRVQMRTDVGPLLQLEKAVTIDLLEWVLASEFYSVPWKFAILAARFWKPALLNWILKRRKLEAYPLERRMLVRYGEDFDPDAFWAAWDAVHTICRNGGNGA